MIQTFITIAISIFLEGLFFILIGVIISSLIEVFVSEETIRKIIPKNKFLALLMSSFLGLIFPICECGIVPVIHKLLKKGVPLYFCITLLFSSPIVNIVVILSTYFAFSDVIQIVIFRVAGGVLISFTAGLLANIFIKNNNIYNNKLVLNQNSCNYHSHNKENKISKIKLIINHSIDEFFDTSKYFIIGILITALIQSVVPRNNLTSFGKNFPLSNLFMIAFPYVLSVCSNTDAFIARAFLNQFNISALLCFLIFGAMFDIKTTIMLKKIFKTSFIIRYYSLFNINNFFDFIIFLFSGTNNEVITYGENKKYQFGGIY